LLFGGIFHKNPGVAMCIFDKLNIQTFGLGEVPWPELELFDYGEVLLGHRHLDNTIWVLAERME